ncbi:MAG TPA: 4Fe-4S ferredoxin [Clostridiales bacterium]|nr:4Fe-4S ferredoxin [Clostridiales bacterium]
MKRRKANILQNYCVACGCCLKACPKDAISITKGIYAVVDKNKCIGCGLCEKACPASIIRMEELS